MSSVQIRATKPDRKTPAPQKQSTESPARQKPHASPLSPGDDLHSLIETRAYERSGERAYQHGYALDNWLDVERETLSRIPPTTQAHDVHA